MTAELVAHFAAADAADPAGDHARMLLKARKKIRDSEGSAAPRYWAAFVLIGPP